MGKRIDADGEEDFAAGDARGRAGSGEGGGVFSSDGEHQLSAYGISVDHFAARDGGAVLSGMVSGADDRPAAVRGVDVLDFGILSFGGARALSKNLETHVSLSALRDGGGHRPIGAQRDGGDRSDFRREVGIRAHTQISSGSGRAA